MSWRGLCGSPRQDIPLPQVGNARDRVWEISAWPAPRATRRLVKSPQCPRVNGWKFTGLRRSDARSKLGWSGSQPVILFYAGIGVHKRRKNLPLAEATMIELRQSHPLAKLDTFSSIPQADVALKM